MLITAPFSLNMYNKTLQSLTWHRTSIQDTVKQVNKCEHIKNVERFPRLDRNIVKS